MWQSDGTGGDRKRAFKVHPERKMNICEECQSVWGTTNVKSPPVFRGLKFSLCGPQISLILCSKGSKLQCFSGKDLTSEAVINKTDGDHQRYRDSSLMTFHRNIKTSSKGVEKLVLHTTSLHYSQFPSDPKGSWNYCQIHINNNRAITLGCCFLFFIFMAPVMKSAGNLGTNPTS